MLLPSKMNKCLLGYRHPKRRRLRRTVSRTTIDNSLFVLHGQLLFLPLVVLGRTYLGEMLFYNFDQVGSPGFYEVRSLGLNHDTH
jgi:hypothetical protein